MGDYDVTLRYMARTPCSGTLGQLGARKVLATAETEFPSVRDRRINYIELVEGAGRRRWLQQIEFQSHRDAGMLGRMVGYRGDIADWLTSKSAKRHEITAPPGARYGRPFSTLVISDGLRSPR